MGGQITVYNATSAPQLTAKTEFSSVKLAESCSPGANASKSVVHFFEVVLKVLSGRHHHL